VYSFLHYQKSAIVKIQAAIIAIAIVVAAVGGVFAYYTYFAPAPPAAKIPIELAGKYILEDYPTAYIELKEDGTYYHAPYTGKWRVEGDGVILENYGWAGGGDVWFRIVDDTLLDESTGNRWVKTTPFSEDVEWLAKVIASEAGSVYDTEKGSWIKCTDTERVAVGWTVLNRLKMGFGGATTIKEVVTAPGQYAYGQKPAPEIRELAIKLLQDRIPDPTGGATHFFSPISMPWQGDEGKFIERLGKHFDEFDTGGGLHEVPGISKKVYFPSWTKTYVWVGDLENVRRAYFMFYRQS